MNNNESPLIPQGSLLEQKNKSRIRVKIAVFFVLAVHGLGLMALLMIGCQKEKEPAPLPTSPEASSQTPAQAPTMEPTNQATWPESNAAPAAPTLTTTQAPAHLQATPEPIPAVPATPSPAAGGTEYKIVKGDTLGKIAKRHHVSLQALQSANPGVDSAKLKIGQVLQIPAATPAPARPSDSISTTPGVGAPGATESTPSGSEHVYAVKSGDSLTRIAGQFKVSVKAIRAANNLKTDKIKVGQKLKIPGKTAVSSAPASTLPAVPAPEPTSSTSATAPTPAPTDR